MNRTLFIVGSLSAFLVQGCAVAGGIFKAGIWVGILIVVLIVVVILAVVNKSRK